MNNATTETWEENQECGIPEANGKVCFKCYQEVQCYGDCNMFIGFSDMEVDMTLVRSFQ